MISSHGTGTILAGKSQSGDKRSHVHLNFVWGQGLVGSSAAAFEALSCLIKIRQDQNLFFNARAALDWQMSLDPLETWVGLFFFSFVLFHRLFHHSKCDWGLEYIIQKCSSAYEFVRSYPSYESVIRSANSLLYLPSSSLYCQWGVQSHFPLCICGMILSSEFVHTSSYVS